MYPASELDIAVVLNAMVLVLCLPLPPASSPALLPFANISS